MPEIIKSPTEYFGAVKNTVFPNEYIITDELENIVCRYKFFTEEINFYQYNMPRRLLRELHDLLNKLNTLHA